ncbi:SDR family NAD(P)-dependent oxidoreductase [Pseudomonas gingeri]|uniref:SDR family oxidoreductase n=1 Tax=Pseudomonas gingeri TaxID=117681 RepID=A0A7Y7YAK8_9PSED|nr:SDR family oxidoreductase [Pseudomonas gingeri]NVZ99072.1 SDR family oxidoreductase [Pseudomonas gingeri]NWA13117.1 SDR family oxidoreductase [Pseudomonas gingeri]NWA55378.1 SDR family oxidoreductase [Pseudomonas gingeri]NWA95768.1 SDR family oxidoreductase [Pseudomonas gingeri]NWB00856.1 SDR family oxidoreductase [Pseudomonas gingeri]
MDYQLTGKTALITGGATGIGKAIAHGFLLEGANVVISGLLEEEVTQALEELGPRSKGLAGDLTQAGVPEQLVALAREFGPIDFLINNVGIFEVRDFFDTDDARWLHYFNVNVMSGVRMSRLVMNDMLSRGEGSVVFISSESAVKPQPWMVHYGAMKACLLGLSRALAELTRGTAVRVNSILPGPTATEAVRRYHREIAEEKGISPQQVVADYFDETEPTSLIRRMIEPEEVARSVLHLAASPALNGMAMRVEGGTIRSIL